MKRLHGLAEAALHFEETRWSPDTPLPEAVRKRTRDIFGEDLTAAGVAARVVDDVRQEGDAAVVRYSSAIDGERLAFIEVPPDRTREALAGIPSNLRDSLNTASSRIREFQQAAMPAGWHDADRHFGEIVTPVARAGLYVPGGTAPLFSTVLMTAIPARLAGVGEVVLCTPASGESLPDQTVLAAAALTGVDRVFKIGGAQAIAAMALGTETVPRVDLICGPGNAFVVAAKKQLYGEVGIDGLFGPTETLIVADDSVSPELCAADLIAQAEHDVMAKPVLVTVDETFADAVERELEIQLARLDRQLIASMAIEQNAVVVIVSDVEEAVEVANVMAPEHFCLAVRDPLEYVPMVQSAGGLFLGEHSAEVLGDYIAGPSHVMPTGGTARFASALSVRSFLKFMPVVDFNEQDVIDLGEDAARMARAEQLTGHAASAETRLRRLVGR